MSDETKTAAHSRWQKHYRDLPQLLDLLKSFSRACFGDILLNMLHAKNNKDYNDL